ncbi:S9 family peptidase [Streptomyces sp. NPDC086091]|uniref:S9 family peptidase n=1 Tax=Streptomyces sp. NPDC086091 TaxID=3365751 RepID=UPI00382C6D08
MSGGTGTTTGDRPAPDPPGAPAPQRAAPSGTSSDGQRRRTPPVPVAAPAPRPLPAAAPSLRALPDASGPRDATTPLRAHGCWYPSAAPDGTEAAYLCDRGGVPQLWAGPVDGDGTHLLDATDDPVKEVSWSPDGRWIGYTTAPGGRGLTRVLCVRPDGTGRRVLAGTDRGSSAHLGCWTHDGAALAVTVAAPPGGVRPGGLLAPGAGPADSAGTADGGTLSAYLLDPDGLASPALLATETHAATLRVCDLSRDGRLVLLRRGPRGRREAVVRRTADGTEACVVPVADGDPWIGRFAPDARTLWLRSDAGREHAALLAAALAPDGTLTGVSVAAERPGSALDLLTLAHDARTAALVWNEQGASALELADLHPADPARYAPRPATVLTAPADDVRRAVDLPHEVVTRVAPAGPGRLLLALSGSRRRPGVWWLHQGVSLLRTPWTARAEDTVPGRPPVRPVPVRFTARDGLPLTGWYHRAPGRGPRDPAPCVVHLHGGPEEQERPVYDALYHELTARGLDVFAPDVRGSGGHGRSFVDADLGAGRFDALNDVADCAAQAVAAGPADPTRLAVMGHSYGGYLTFASVVWHPDLFRTGVAVCGMSDLLTFFAGTEPWLAESAAHKYGHPDRDRDLLRALSPMTRIDALRVPVLAVHGEHDTNVPPGESEQFVRAARERGVPAELLTLRDEGHDFLRADSRRLFRRTAADWLERHLTR